jgi:hypothetical protein
MWRLISVSLACLFRKNCLPPLIDTYFPNGLREMGWFSRAPSPTSTHNNKRIQVKVILRPTVSRPVCLGVRHPSGTRDQFVLLLPLIILDNYGFVDVGRPLWREVGSVVAFLRCESHGTHEHALLSLFLRLPQHEGRDSCSYFPQEQGSTVIFPCIGLIKELLETLFSIVLSMSCVSFPSVLARQRLDEHVLEVSCMCSTL